MSWLSDVLHLPQIPFAGVYLELDFKRPELSLDLALTSENEHAIAGQLLLGYRGYLVDLELFAVQGEAVWAGFSGCVEVG